MASGIAKYNDGVLPGSKMTVLDELYGEGGKQMRPLSAPGKYVAVSIFIFRALFLRHSLWALKYNRRRGGNIRFEITLGAT